MELSSSRKVASRSVTQEFPKTLRSRNRYRVHKSLRLVPVTSQTNPVLPLHLFFYKIHLNIIFPFTSVSSLWPTSFWLSYRNPVHISFRFRACYMLCPSHFSSHENSNYVWLAVQVMKILLWKFLRPPLISFLLGYGILHNALFSNISFNVRYPSRHIILNEW
jgi:hypothetical protein